MRLSKNKHVQDFLVTFFIGNHICNYMLSEILENSNNQQFLNILGLPSDFKFPFTLETGESSSEYIYQHVYLNKYEVLLNGVPCEKHILETGDYFSFSNSKNKGFNMLFIKTSDLKLGYKKHILQKDTNLFIGRTPINDISYNLTNYIAREKHAAIRIDANGHAFVEDLKRTIGIYVNGNRVHSQELHQFDEIYLMGLSILYMGDYIAIRDLNIDCSLPELAFFETKRPIENCDKKYFVCTPRILKSIDNDEVEVEAPPAPFTLDKTPTILTIGPSVTMSIVMLASLGISLTNAIIGGKVSTIVISGTMAVGMLLGSLVWPTLLRNYQKKCVINEENNRKDRYSSYIKEIDDSLKRKKERNIYLLDEFINPSPKIMCSLLNNEKTKLRLWERSYQDDDFLSVRIGIGKRPFDIDLKIPKNGFHLHDDNLRELPNKLSEKYSILENAPITLDLFNIHTIGLIGKKNNINLLLNQIVLNIASLHSYDEVKIVIVTSVKQIRDFENFKNLQHVWSNDKKIRYFATNPEEVHYVFNSIDENIRVKKEKQGSEFVPIPYYVFIIMEPDLIENEPLLRYLYDSENRVGITTIFAYGDITKLPKTCQTIVQSDDNCTGYYSKNKNKNKFVPFNLDSIDLKQIHKFFNELSHLPIQRDKNTLSIVDRISFLQMYKVGNIDELNIESHWDNNNSNKSLAVPVGVTAGGQVFNLDLHESYHGCHGLVAGTTGSGKSEFLQAFVLSLAINFSPKEVAFVLVDFKGGDMARPFMKKPFAPSLPHLSATISNLSGNVLYRALVSLDAEIKSRQRIFNEASQILSVDKLDINSYHKYYKNGRLSMPLPHLIIIIDEFAQLKTQHPEFLEKLIDVAQVGRSLGIHLILATQKPSGVVDPQIMSNSRFKVCLKVAEKQDSIDLLNKPDSAYIKNPGRLYLQVGYDEIYACIQSGYSGADYLPTKTYQPDENITVQMINYAASSIHSEKLDLSINHTDQTQLEAIVSRIVSLGQKKNLRAKPLWLDMLPERILLSELEKTRKGLCTAIIGLADLVKKQKQKTLIHDFSKDGHIALYGASGMGKTTFIHTLIYSMVGEYGYTPEELNIYAMDFGGRNLSYLSTLPHTGGVAFAEDESKIVYLLSILKNLIEERKRLFANKQCGTFIDYRKLSNQSLPAILVLIDNYGSFRDKYINLCEEFTEIISLGKTFGIYFVITGSTKNSIHYKVIEYISSSYVLKMNDSSNYLDILNVRTPIIPENISGRGITVINKEIIEFQTAIVYGGSTDSDIFDVINNKYNEIANEWNGYIPPKLDILVEESKETNVSYIGHKNFFSNQALPEPICEDETNIVIGKSLSGTQMYGISMNEDYRLCLCYDSIDNLKKYYHYLLSSLTEYIHNRIIFVDDDSKNYKEVIEKYPSIMYISGSSELDYFIESLKPELNMRLEDNNDEFEQFIIIIPDFNAFFEMITNNQADFMRKVFKYINDPKYKICFVCGFNVNKDKNNDYLYLSLIVNAENFVAFPGCIEKASMKIERFPLITDVNQNNGYFIFKEKNVEIRW